MSPYLSVRDPSVRAGVERVRVAADTRWRRQGVASRINPPERVMLGSADSGMSRT